MSMIAVIVAAVAFGVAFGVAVYAVAYSKTVQRNLENHFQDTRTVRRHGSYVGKGTDIIDSFVDVAYPHLVSIGDGCTITNATILAHDASTQKHLGFTKEGEVQIGNNCFIGYGSIILPGVTIGNNVIVGAGSIVTHNIPDKSVVAGNPAKVICSYDDYMEKMKLRKP